MGGQMGQWERTDSGIWGVRWDSGKGRTVRFGGSGGTVYSGGAVDFYA